MPSIRYSRAASRIHLAIFRTKPPIPEPAPSYLADVADRIAVMVAIVPVVAILTLVSCVAIVR